MEGWRVGLALGLPWLAGTLWLRGFWRDAPAGIWPLVLGYGGVMGLLMVTLLLRVQAAVGLPLSFHRSDFDRGFADAVGWLAGVAADLRRRLGPDLYGGDWREAGS